MKTFNFSYLLKGEFMNSNNLGNRLFPTGLYLLVIIAFTIYLFSHKLTVLSSVSLKIILYMTSPFP